MKQTKQSLAVEMQCTGCEEIINSAVIKLDGVDKVKADFANSTVEFFSILIKLP